MGLYSGVLHIHMLRLFFIFSFDLTINIHGFFGFFIKFIGRKSVFEIGICCANQHGIKAKIVINSSILLDFQVPEYTILSK